MALTEITVDKADIPLWKDAPGAVVIQAAVDDPRAPLVPGDNPIVVASLNIGGASGIVLGDVSSVRLGIRAGSRFTLAPIWKEHIGNAPGLVSEFDLANMLTPENMLLAIVVGADADLSVPGSFAYSVLTAGATLSAGVDARLVYVRAVPRNASFADAIRRLFGGMRLPAGVTVPPEPGEVVSLEVGGYLNFGVSASAGYDVKGTNDLDIGRLALSEHYALSIVGKMTANARLAGRFAVTVRAASDPGWARVMVCRKRTKDLHVAADLDVGVTLETQGLPASGKEFLGALIGIRAKNWLNLVSSIADEAGTIGSLEHLKVRLDGLAGDFIKHYAGKAIDELLPAEAAALLSRLERVATSYRGLDQSAIALVDRYTDPLLDKTKDLEEHLTSLAAITAWDELAGENDPVLWNIIRQLTDGEPLGWMLGAIPGTSTASLAVFKKRVNDALSLLRDAAHEEVRNIIELAKRAFGLDDLMSALASVDSPDKLKTVLSDKTRHFAERLLNRQLDKLNTRELKKAFGIVEQIVKAKDQFWQTFDDALTHAAKENISIGIHAAYASADERDALIDADVRLLNDDGTPCPAGQRFLSLAAQADFGELLAKYQPTVVRLRQGRLTHQSRTTTGVKINVVGWHQNFQYEEVYRVIVNADQQLRTTSTGMLNVFTTVDMTAEKERRRKSTKTEEELHTNFVLRFLGETRVMPGQRKFDQQTREYLIDVITGQCASYNVTFTDARTTPKQLQRAMLYAKTLGLDTAGATQEAIAPLLDLSDGHFGPVTTEYNVRFTEVGLANLFTRRLPPQELAAAVRGILTRVVLANYVGQGNIADVGWLYASDDVKRLYDDARNNFINTDSPLGDALHAREVSVTSPIPGIRPGRIANTFAIRSLAARLFDLEREMTQAFHELQDVLHETGGINLERLSERLKTFGKVLECFDNSTLGDNTVFAVFDGLVQLATPAEQARSSALAITITKGGKTHQLVFTLQAQSSVSRPSAVGAPHQQSG